MKDQINPRAKSQRRTHEKWSQDKNLHYREIDFFDFTGRPLANADYLTHTYIGHWEICTFSRVTGST